MSPNSPNSPSTGARTSTARPPLRFGVAHDFRCPPGSDFTLQDVYAQTFEQLKLLDRLGLDLVWFSEHHFVEDGYLPSFAPVAGAAAAVTEQMRISTDIALAPFSHPIRLAEDLAILDQVSNGRMEIGLGLGYAPHEFRAFGIPRKNRVSLTEECMDILKLAWQGEPFSYRGKRYQFSDVHVTPHPVQPGGPPLWTATTSPASVDRALRYDTHVLPQGVRSIVLDRWRDKMRADGRDPDRHRVGIIRSILVTDDPERDWPAVRDAERYRMRVYSRFFQEAGEGGRQVFEQDGRISQRHIVGDVQHCADELTKFVLDHGFTDVVTWGSAPGLLPAHFTPSMERFTNEVVPLVRARVAAAALPPA
jgi:alkanesulfonate monooxygenase SsuD/methylene tetrahydromethanopterin reductase-like flavin-dependent oxidoreductase (luciferase family)